MGFLTSKDESPDKWKEKYFNLLDAQDQVEKEHQANEDLLCKTIVRFALAVKGLNKELDPHLSRIRNLLKSGLKSHQLHKELEDFSQALMHMEDKPNITQHDSALLFEFLDKQYPKLKSQFAALAQRFEAGEFASSDALAIALLEQINAQQERSHPVLPASTDAPALNEHLLRLLDNIEIPDEYESRVSSLREDLLSQQPLAPIIDNTINLLLSLRRHFDKQQQEMASFLTKLTDELADLGLKATGANVANEHVAKKRNLLDQTVSEQMSDLQQKSASATQLEPLKQLINSRLQNISQQIQAHNQQERIEREKVQHELSVLTAKIRGMETETTDLKSKLAAAHQRATRDPLTGLPNRLAFDERLTAEMARVKRYRTHLSMAIWDIDFFKRVNDTFGHKSGDKALVVIAKLLSQHCRETDFVARFGGEEFVMLLTETDASHALVVTNKIRELIEKSSFNANGERVSITLSCGISQFREGESSDVVFERADACLYQAKQKGRNQCIAE